MYTVSEAALKDIKCATVNKALLASFYSHSISEVTDEELAEVIKVVNVVLKVHFSSYFSYWEDLRSQALLTIFERHDRYESGYPALGFCYTIARNEVGNLLRRLIRENLCDLGGSSMVNSHKVSEAVPTELGDYLYFLSGEAPCGRMVIPSGVAGALLVFCERGCSGCSLDTARERVLLNLLENIRLC